MTPNLYFILGVPPGSSQGELRAAYIKLCVRLHPDKGGRVEDFAPVSAAYDLLKDPLKRYEYDKQLRIRGRQCKRCEGAGLRFISFRNKEKTICEACQGTGEQK